MPSGYKLRLGCRPKSNRVLPAPTPHTSPQPVTTLSGPTADANRKKPEGKPDDSKAGSRRPRHGAGRGHSPRHSRPRKGHRPAGAGRGVLFAPKHQPAPRGLPAAQRPGAGQRPRRPAAARHFKHNLRQRLDFLGEGVVAPPRAPRGGLPPAGRAPGACRCSAPARRPPATGRVAQAEAPSLPRTLAPSGMALCCFSTCTAVGAVGRAWGAAAGTAGQGSQSAARAPAIATQQAILRGGIHPFVPHPLPPHRSHSTPALPTTHHPLCAPAVRCAPFSACPTPKHNSSSHPSALLSPTIPLPPCRPDHHHHTHTHSKRAALIVTTPH